MFARSQHGIFPLEVTMLTLPAYRPGRQVALALLMTFTLAVPLAQAQETQEKPQAEKKAAPVPTSKSGKKLLRATDVLRLDNVGTPVLSPDGTRIAYTLAVTDMPGPDKEWRNITHIWVVSVTGGDARQFTRGSQSATNPAWSPDGKKLAFLTSRDGQEGGRQIWMMYADGGEAWQITEHKGGVSTFSFSPDGRQIAFLAADQPSKEEEQRKKLKDDTVVVDKDIRMTHLWVFDLEKKEEKRLTEGNFTVSDPQWSPDGKQIAFVTRPTPRADDGARSDVWVLDVASGQKRQLAAGPGPEDSPRWSPDGKWIAFTGAPEFTVGRSELYIVAADGGVPRSLTENFDLTADTPLWAPDGKTIYFNTTTRQAVEVFAADVGAGSVRQVSRFGGVTTVSEISADGRTVFGNITQANAPEQLFRADAGFAKLERLTNHNAWLQDYALGEVEIVKWTSRDGIEIEGVLTKPVDFDPSKKYPLLLNPHGGPTAASLAAFNATAQLFAANGYLVLQPNFRGSTGRGVEFAQANRNNWGKGDYQDCITGVEAMVARGLADRDRLGAFGWSYGGYMTFWILTQTDIFKAVSPGAGLTNLYSMYSQNDIPRYLGWFFGSKAPWDAFEIYWEHSAMRYIKNVKTPTLIMHGERDQRVPIAQAQEFYRALVEMGVPVEFVVFPREGHGISEPRHQLDRLRRWLYFFGEYLHNPPVTEPDAEKK